MKLRTPAVAGMFYPADAAQLRHEIDALLQSAPITTGPAPKVLILPHAGYVYSGLPAATALNRLRASATGITRVVLFGPAHRVYVDGMAIPSAASFATPLGTIPLDRASLDSLATLPGVAESDLAHRDEHSLEVQLPFLQTVLDEFTLVPVVVGHAAPATVAAAIDMLWGGPETLLVISSDLSHFHGYDDARQIDNATCQAILRKSTKLSGEQACGAHAINGLMQSQHCRDLDIEQLALCNSGDTAGDKHRVVGYGAFVLH